MADTSLDKIYRELMREHGADGGKLPPVASWNPPLSGDIDIRIARDGTWYHDGAPIRREALVKLFSSILKREEDDYFLVTPGEKWRIRVDDAPFAVTRLERLQRRGHQVLVLTTSTEDRVVAGPQNPLWVVIDPGSGEPSPYLRVRANLDGLIARPVYYQLAAMAEERQQGGTTVHGVTSLGVFYPLM